MLRCCDVDVWQLVGKPNGIALQTASLCKRHRFAISFSPLMFLRTPYDFIHFFIANKLCQKMMFGHLR